MSPKYAQCKDTLNKYGWEADDVTVGHACRALHLERHGVWADMTTLRVRWQRLYLSAKTFTCLARLI